MTDVVCVRIYQNKCHNHCVCHCLHDLTLAENRDFSSHHADNNKVHTSGKWKS